MDLGYQYEKVILGSSYCSGFVDSNGRWNQGFYCPETEEISDVFCCGSQTDKFCCTKADQRIMDDGERYSNTVTLILVSLFGLLLVITSVSCIFCSSLHNLWCWRRSRKMLDKWQMSRAGPRVPDTGPASLDSGALVTSSSCDTFLGPPGARDQYLASTCQTQVILAPLDNDLSILKNQARDGLGTLSRNHHGHPPPYNILPLGSYIIVPQDSLVSGSGQAPDLICETQAQVDAAAFPTVEEDFFSTKF